MQGKPLEDHGLVEGREEGSEKTKKIKILVADTAPLYPPLWGGPRRIFDLYTNLEGCSVNYVGLNVEKGFKRTEKKVSKNTLEIIVPPSLLGLALRKAQRLLLPGLTFDLYSYLFVRRDRNFKKEIRLLEKDSTLLVSSHPWSFPAFRKRKGPIKVYDAHNVEYDLMRQITKDRTFTKLISYFVKRIETAACRESDIIICCSQEDKERLSKSYDVAEDKIFVIPNCTDSDLFRPASTYERDEQKKAMGIKGPCILFVGSFYNPNIEAFGFIIKELAPKLEGCTFLIVGSVSHAIEGFVSDTAIPSNVKVLGPLAYDGLRKAMKASDIAINPTFSGSGIHIKMLDYMAAGLPIISTPLGARGLGIEDGKEALIAGPAVFHDAISRLVADKESREALSMKGRIKSLEFDSKILSGRLQEILFKNCGVAPQETLEEPAVGEREK